MIERGRYTSGRIAVANLSASIAALESRRAADTSVEDLLALSNLLFVRGDLLGRTVDHDRAESVANEAIASSRDTARALYVRARLAARFHRFSEAGTLLDRALASGHPAREADAERAALFQATGRFSEALVLRKKLATEHHGVRHRRRARNPARGNESMGGGRKLLRSGARCRSWHLASPKRPAAVRMGRERHAPRRPGTCGRDLRPARGDIARARSRAWASRRGRLGARAPGRPLPR